jgi:RNA polymerase sigma-70 factor (ECF subfamily)
MVFRIALAHVKARHDADDVFQEVFLRYVSKKRVFDSEEHRKAWFIRVTINRCKSLWASAWFRKTEMLDDNMPAEHKDQDSLIEYLRLLPQKYRSVIHLFYGEDMSVREIAEILKQKEATVRVWLSRARKILGEKLRGERNCGLEII